MVVSMVKSEEDDVAEAMMGESKDRSTPFPLDLGEGTRARSPFDDKE